MSVKKPCIGCIYFDACGSSTRTKHCAGRKTERERKKEKERGDRKHEDDEKYF